MLLEHPPTGDGLFVQAGDSAFGVTVVRAEPRRALVRWNGQEVWLWAGVGRGNGKPAGSQAPGTTNEAGGEGRRSRGPGKPADRPTKNPQAGPSAATATGAPRTAAQIRSEIDEVLSRSDVEATYRRVYEQYPQEGAQIAEELRTIVTEQGWMAWEARARELGVLVEK